MTKEVFEKLTKVMASDEFGEKFEACTSMDDLLALLKKDYGIEISAAELQDYLGSIDGPASGDGELDDDALEMVSGGGAIWNWISGQVKSIKNKFEYILGGGWVMDVATGKKRHPWV